MKYGSNPLRSHVSSNRSSYAGLIKTAWHIDSKSSNTMADFSKRVDQGSQHSAFIVSARLMSILNLNPIARVSL